MRIPGFIRRDFALKFVSLVLAVCTYVGVSGYLKEESTVALPVEIHLTQDLMMTQPQNFKVEVKVRGNKRDMGKADEIRCRVEVAPGDRHSDGSYHVKLTARDFRTPGGLRVIQILNPELTLQLQRRISRELPVRMVISGEPPPGFRVSERICIPKTVVVSGPENALGELKEVLTEPIPLSDRESSFDYEVKLRRPAQLKLSVERVTVNIGVERNFVTRDFAKVPVGVFCDAQSGVVARFNADSPSFAAVRIVGTASDIARFRTNDVRLYVDVSDISTAGEYTLPVRCHIRREGIRIKQVTPAQFKVTVSKMPIKK